MELTQQNIEVFAAKHYLNETCLSQEEFEEDFRRFASIKKMIGRLRSGKNTNIRLLANHLLCLTNVFELRAVKEILLFNTKEEDKEIYKTLFNYFGYITINEMPNVKFSLKTARLLREMDR